MYNIPVHKAVCRFFFPCDQYLEAELLNQRIWMNLCDMPDTLPKWPTEKVCPCSTPCLSPLYYEREREVEMGQDNEQERPEWLGNSQSIRITARSNKPFSLPGQTDAWKKRASRDDQQGSQLPGSKHNEPTKTDKSSLAQALLCIYLPPNRSAASCWSHS